MEEPETIKNIKSELKESEGKKPKLVPDVAESFSGQGTQKHKLNE